MMAQVDEVMPPLVQMVSKLSKQGRRAAREIYGLSDNVFLNVSSASFEFLSDLPSNRQAKLQQAANTNARVHSVNGSRDAVGGALHDSGSAPSNSSSLRLPLPRRARNESHFHPSSNNAARDAKKIYLARIRSRMQQEQAGQNRVLTAQVEPNSNDATALNVSQTAASDTSKAPGSSTNDSTVTAEEAQDTIPILDNSAWVCSGFTDGRLKGDFHGGIEVALCEACGAWLATHVFDYLLHIDLRQRKSYDTMKDQILPIFRGLALFFVEHVIQEKDDSGKLFMTHTGPTTSPENHYTLSGKSYNLIIQSTVIAVMNAFPHLALMFSPYRWSTTFLSHDSCLRHFRLARCRQQLPPAGGLD